MIAPVVAGPCDDAAVFPPGLVPLPGAVRAYRERRGAWYADPVGPLVLTGAALPRLASLCAARRGARARTAGERAAS